MKKPCFETDDGYQIEKMREKLWSNIWWDAKQSLLAKKALMTCMDGVLDNFQNDQNMFIQIMGMW